MDKVVWLVAGNKGGAGKSVVAKAMIEWLRRNETPVIIVEGDTRTPDVHTTFQGSSKTVQYDLSDEPGWPQFSDFLCETTFVGHIVANLPDGLSDRMIVYFQRLQSLAVNYGFEVKVLFVLNNLPDGLALFHTLCESFENIFPIKNLHFGSPAEFNAFDVNFAVKFEGRIVLFPRMQSKIMMLVRESSLSYQDFIEQTGDGKSNFSYGKIVVADWRDSMFEALDDVLLGE